MADHSCLLLTNFPTPVVDTDSECGPGWRGMRATRQWHKAAQPGQGRLSRLREIACHPAAQLRPAVSTSTSPSVAPFRLTRIGSTVDGLSRRAELPPCGPSSLTPPARRRAACGLVVQWTLKITLYTIRIMGPSVWKEGGREERARK